MTLTWGHFSQIWVVDFEFHPVKKEGDPPHPICYCAREINSGKTIKHWLTEGDGEPKYSIADDALFVAYFASAEMGCHVALGWEYPKYILDLFTEFRNLTNGRYIPAGRGLLGALTYHGVSSGDTAYKDAMRSRILEGPPFSEIEIKDILDYCDLDVKLTAKLFSCMKDSIDLQRALLRGRYMWAVSIMEYYGVPLNMDALTTLRSKWDSIKNKLIETVDNNYHVYENGVFKAQKFLDYLQKNKLSWELTPSGLPRLDEDFFKDQAKTFPQLKPLQELRYSLSQLKLNDLQVGEDGRNRTLLSPFGTITARNTPSSSRFIFGNAVWLRNLIQPPEGMALAYIDFEQQEIAIAAALSGDENLKQACLSGDPYISFAIQAGVVPPGSTKQSHPEIREQFKTCMIGINYGMSVETFARRANLPLIKAKDLFRMHKTLFRKYWDWITNFCDIGQLTGEVVTCYGWKYSTITRKPRTLQNWPMQAHGAEILRLAICLCLENNIKVIAPIHDAILIEAPIERIEKDARKAQFLMTKASEYVVNYPIQTDVKIIRYPDHYSDPRGDLMWKSVWGVINGA